MAIDILDAMWRQAARHFEGLHHNARSRNGLSFAPRMESGNASNAASRLIRSQTTTPSCCFGAGMRRLATQSSNLLGDIPTYQAACCRRRPLGAKQIPATSVRGVVARDRSTVAALQDTVVRIPRASGRTKRQSFAVIRCVA